MLRVFSALWSAIDRILRFVGNIISTAILSAFYFSIFALFAAPARLFTDYLRRGGKRSNYVEKDVQLETLEQFSHEG